MFEEFDPLAAKQSLQNEVAINAMKRELRNILDSYVGWYDPFCELIQNGLDSIDERAAQQPNGYNPLLRIIINLKNNTLTVTDNGTGMSKEKYKTFLAPCFSFKSGNMRGHKGVGATYLAYGFNFVQIATTDGTFTAVGRMVDARKWLEDPNPVANPKVVPDSDGPVDTAFQAQDKGVSVTLRFDNTTRPGNLTWLQAKTAAQWLKILSLKTGIGALVPNKTIRIEVIVRDAAGSETTESQQGIEYLWPHLILRRTKTYQEIAAKEESLFAKHGVAFRMPSAFCNLDAIYGFLDETALEKIISLDESEKSVCKTYNPEVYFCYTYTAKVWPQFNEELKVRSGQSVLLPGVQIAANNMPQGEVVVVPLRRNVGRQNQIHVVIHLNNCRADLGRKGFQKEIVEFGQAIARKLIEKPIQNKKHYLRPVTGTKDDLGREDLVANWKTEFTTYETENPLVIENDNFFIPTKRVAISSKPTREQDVIALFNQLIAGGVIRGIQIMSTNERFVYDSMYHASFCGQAALHIYDANTNPLGILEELYKQDFISTPRILEYKYSLNALIEDIESGEKNSNDINLVVVWETGSDYEGNYHITSLLDPDNLTERQYHGVTHVMTSISTGQKEMDLIVLSELVQYLNDPVSTIAAQKRKYEPEDDSAEVNSAEGEAETK